MPLSDIGIYNIYIYTVYTILSIKFESGKSYSDIHT